jgi:hypothetical protein
MSESAAVAPVPMDTEAAAREQERNRLLALLDNALHASKTSRALFDTEDPEDIRQLLQQLLPTATPIELAIVQNALISDITQRNAKERALHAGQAASRVAIRGAVAHEDCERLLVLSFTPLSFSLSLRACQAPSVPLLLLPLRRRRSSGHTSVSEPRPS